MPGDHDNDDVMICHSESDHELIVKVILNLGEKVEANGSLIIGLICEWQLHVIMNFCYQIYCVTSQVKTNTERFEHHSMHCRRSIILVW